MLKQWQADEEVEGSKVEGRIYLIAPAIHYLTFDFHAPIRWGRLSTLFRGGDLLVSRRGKESCE
jgi:hypothetical protein